MNSGNSNFTPSHCTTDVPTDTGVENKHESSPKLDITSDEDDDEYYSLGYDDITSADDTLSYTSAIDSKSDNEDTIYNENDASAIDTEVDNEELTEGVVIEESALPSKHTIAEDLNTDLASANIMSEDKHKAANTFCKTDTTSAIHSHAPEGNVSFDENDTPAVDSSSTTSGAAVLNVDKSSSSDSENASLIAQGHPSSIAGLLPLNDSASDQSFIDLATSYVDAIDQYLQSANAEDSSATHCLVEPPTSEVHGDVVVPAGITSYNKEVDDVGDTRNDSDHHSLAADTGIQNDNATSTAVDITKWAITPNEESLETNVAREDQTQCNTLLNGSTSLQYKALSADIVEMAAVLISPSVEQNITTTKSEAARATSSIECSHNDVTSGQIEDYETQLETRSVQRNASSHSSVGIPVSQKYGGAGTSRVSLFLHCV